MLFLSEGPVFLMNFEKTKVAKAVGWIFSLSLGVPASEAAVIDLDQISGNEIVLTEDSSLLQSYLPRISEGATFAIKGKHTFTIGPSDASAMVDTYANATLQVEGSLSLIGNEAFGAMHTNQGSTIAID